METRSGLTSRIDSDVGERLAGGRTSCQVPVTMTVSDRINQSAHYVSPIILVPLILKPPLFEAKPLIRF